MPADPANAASSAGAVLRSRAFTPFNALLTALVVLAVGLGAWAALIPAAVLLGDIALGTRADRVVARRSSRYTAPDTAEATVVRDGDHRLVTPEDLAPGDVVELEPGAPVVADGDVVAADGLEIDESQVTGAALPVARRRGDTVTAGSFVTAGRGRVEVRTTVTATPATPVERSDHAPPTVPPVRAGINRLTPALAALAGALGLVVAGVQLVDGLTVTNLRAPAAGLVALVPVGLLLLATVTTIRATRTLHGQRVAVRDPDAVTGLAGVDILCVDKTGTLTEPVLDVVQLELVKPATEDAADIRRVLGAIAWADPRPGAISSALATAFPSPRWTSTVVHPFSSGRRAAAAGFTGHGDWLLGAPDVVLPADGDIPGHQAATELVETAGWSGRRVLLLARTHEPVPEGPLTAAPAATPVAAVSFEERLRPDAAETLTGLRRQGVGVKVLSGDDALAAAGVAARLDLPGADSPVDGRRLPSDGLAEAAEERTVFGNLDGEQKRDLVAALRSRGHRVAMVGDGVNDLPALAEADLGVVLGSGSPAARAAAPVVLADSRLRPLVALQNQGTRVMDTVERLADLFLTKTVTAALLVLAVGAAGATMPLEPGHLALVLLLGLVAPAVALVLADGTGGGAGAGKERGADRPRRAGGFVEQSLRCALPTGAVATAAVFASRTLAEDTVDTSRAGAATSAALTLFLVVLWLVATLLKAISPGAGAAGTAEAEAERRFPLRVTLPVGLAGAFAAALFVPPLRSWFGLEVDGTLALLSGVGVAAIAGVALEVAWQTSGWERPRP